MFTQDERVRLRLPWIYVEANAVAIFDNCGARYVDGCDDIQPGLTLTLRAASGINDRTTLDTPVTVLIGHAQQCLTAPAAGNHKVHGNVDAVGATLNGANFTTGDLGRGAQRQTVGILVSG